MPTIDVSGYLESRDPEDLRSCAAQVRDASEQVGFYTLTGHGVPVNLIDAAFVTARRFFALSLTDKQRLLMDRTDWPLGGVGYLPVGERKLPHRSKGNRNEAFLVKSGQQIGIEDNQWPGEVELPGMRELLTSYGTAMTDLARSLLPIYAVALELEPGFFDAAFTAPFYRLRMTHYPPLRSDELDDYSIAPHVDSTFITILAQESAGLTIHSEARDLWLDVPDLGDGLVVNTGELLKQWTNDRFVSVKHFVRNDGDAPRYSIPFFLNANADYVMECLPSCQGPDNPPRYPPMSYLQSQAVAQGE